MKDKKRPIVRLVDDNIDWDGFTISKIRKDLDRLEKLGASYIDIEVEVAHGLGVMTIYAMKDDMETDEELKNMLTND